MSEYFLLGEKKFVPVTGGISLPADGNFAFINHDDIANDEKGQRIRAPEVYPLWEVAYTDLNEGWQWFWFRVGLVHPYTGYETWDEKRLMSSELSRLKQEWKSLTHGEKAFTNNHGTNGLRADGSDGGIDYINGIQNAGKMAKQGAITCCGNIVKVIGNPTNRGTPIETLDGTKPPPDPAKVNRIKTPWLIFAAVNIPGYVSGGKEFPHYVTVDGVRRVKADPFPNIHDIPTRRSDDTLVPLRSNSNKTGVRYSRDGVSYAGNWINTARLVTVTTLPRAYVP